MSITEKEVIHVANLARIALDEGEIAHYTNEINGILAWVEDLQSVNTANVPPLASVVQQGLPLRADIVTDGNKQADILANAKDVQYGCFSVPKVIE
jgi:aspartyl-tRNA(Asn)/glutamyl-tRNA(Gln) amidotransferase subunit C